MSRAERVLTHDQAKRFYDRMGARQDSQAFYEDEATGELVRHLDLARATAVVELGCGTGRFAAGLLAHQLPQEARYLGIDVSATMCALARERLAPFAARAEIRQSDGDVQIDEPAASFDRFVSSYVLDLLSAEDIRTVFAEAGRLLRPAGLLGLASLTQPFTAGSRLVMAGWSLLYRLRPALVGGCRPVDLAAALPEHGWRLRHQRRLSPYGLPSEVLVAERSE